MKTTIAIDPGMSKCGLVIADIKQKKVSEALVIQSNHLLTFIRKIYQKSMNKVFAIILATVLILTSSSALTDIIIDVLSL